MDDTTEVDAVPEPDHDAPDSDVSDTDEITEEEMQRSLEKLFLRYEQMLRNLAE